MNLSTKKNLAACSLGSAGGFAARARQLVSFSRSHPPQCGEPAHAAQFRLQRRHRRVRVRRGLCRDHLLRQDGAGARLRGGDDADFPAGLAALRRLCRAVRDLYRHHRQCRRTIRRHRNHRRVQCHRHRRPSDPDPDAWPDAAGEAAQSRHAAIVRRPDGDISAAAVVDAAAAEPHARGLDRALCRRALVRLEPAGLPDRELVLQPVLLAAAVRARRLVCGQRHEADGRRAAPWLAAPGGGRLSSSSRW